MSIITEMKQKDKSDKINRLIGKLISIIRPKGVLDISYDLEVSGDSDSPNYYLTLKYVVPDDSDALKIKNTDWYRLVWNTEIQNMIKDYIGIKVISKGLFGNYNYLFFQRSKKIQVLLEKFYT